MEQVFVANPKGGCGKTTISTQLAAYFAMRGQGVLLVDHDALKGSSDWLAGRPASQPKIALAIAGVDAAVDGNGADWVVHDMPAAWSLEKVHDTLQAEDRVLIPVLASPNDIKACLRFIMRLHRSGMLERGIRVGLIANRARTYTRYYKILQAFLSRLQLPLVTSLRDTQNYVRVMDAGLSIFDLPPNRVQADLAQWRPLIDWLCNSDLGSRDLGSGL